MSLREEYERETGDKLPVGASLLECEEQLDRRVAWLERRAEKWEAVAGVMFEAAKNARGFAANVSDGAINVVMAKRVYVSLGVALVAHEAAKGAVK